MRRGVLTQLPLAEKSFSYFGDFNCLFASERNEMVENWLMTFFALTCPRLTCMVL